MTPPVTTGQIYWGAIPFVVIQLIMVALIIAFPNLVTYDKAVAADSGAPVIDIQKMIQEDASKAGGGGEALAPASPPTPAQDDDALMKSLREAPK